MRAPDPRRSTSPSTPRRVLATISAIAVVIGLVVAVAPNAGASVTARTADGSKDANAAGWTGAGTTVAVIDTGIQSNHPYLKHNGVSKVVAEACFVTAVPAASFASTCPNGVSMSPTDPALPGSGQPCTIADAANYCTHGTHVAGIVAGEPGTMQPLTLSGVAPGANLISIKVFGERTVNGAKYVVSQPSDIINALTWLFNHRSDYPTLTAVNISIAGTNYADGSNNCDARTGYPTDAKYKTVIDNLRNANIATIVSAGNTAWDDAVSAPACVSSAVAVSAVDDTTNTRWVSSPTLGSNMGTAVDLMAPGAHIYSSLPVTNTAITPFSTEDSGTSAAAPAVAGAWAVMRQRYPTMPVGEVLAKLQAAGTTVTTTVPATASRGAITYSIPRLDLKKAIQNSGVVSSAAGDGASCAVSTDGTVHCAGNNSVGQLGNGTTTNSSTPVAVTGITNASSVATDGRTSCARLSNGTAKCWGANDAGQLGNASVTAAFSSTPVTVMSGASALGSVSSVSVRGGVCAVINKGVNGTLSCWGKVGPNTVNSVPKTMLKKVGLVDTIVAGVTSADVAGTTACATVASQLWCADRSTTPYGLNNAGYAVRVFATGATAITTASSVSLGNGAGCVVLTAGTAKCWRGAIASVGLPSLGNGALSSATAVTNMTPFDVRTSSTALLTGISAIDIGIDHACAIATNGSSPSTKQVYCWGRATSAGTAANSGTTTTYATRIVGTVLNGTTQISAGKGFSLTVSPSAALPITRTVGWGSTVTGTAYGFAPTGTSVAATSLLL